MPDEMTTPDFWQPDVKAARRAAKPGEPLVLRWPGAELAFTLTQEDGETIPADDDSVMVAVWREPFDYVRARDDAEMPVATPVGALGSVIEAIRWINGFCEGWAARGAADGD